jgi:metallophosphoesterase (TIGR00282 family)
MFQAGADVQTGGDHSFDKHLVFGYMNKEERLLRPMNYPKGVPGRGYGLYDLPELGIQIGVINLRGLAFFNNPIHSPMDAADRAIEELSAFTNLLVVDFHAEATAEKVAMGWYLDGRVSAIAGTHTHVQTGDERILPKGTGYITDVGFTGAQDSVIGLDIETSLERHRLQIPRKTKLAERNARILGVLFDLDDKTGKALKVQRINHPVPDRMVMEGLLAEQAEQPNS